MPSPGGMGAALCLFLERALWVAGSSAPFPANELGAFGLINTFCVTGLTCDISQGEAPGRLIIFTFSPCVILDLRQVERHGGVSRMVSSSESCLVSLGQYPSLTEDAQNETEAFGLCHSA